MFCLNFSLKYIFTKICQTFFYNEKHASFNFTQNLGLNFRINFDRQINENIPIISLQENSAFN